MKKKIWALLQTGPATHSGGLGLVRWRRLEFSKGVPKLFSCFHSLSSWLFTFLLLNFFKKRGVKAPPGTKVAPPLDWLISPLASKSDPFFLKRIRFERVKVGTYSLYDHDLYNHCDKMQTCCCCVLAFIKIKIFLKLAQIGGVHAYVPIHIKNIII